MGLGTARLPISPRLRASTRLLRSRHRRLSHVVDHAYIMTTTWNSSIQINENEDIKDITLSSHDEDKENLHGIPKEASLRFLAIVDVDRIPLHLIVGPKYHVSTNSPETEAWFTRHLLSPVNEAFTSWWETARPQSPLGVLVAVSSPQDASSKASHRVTEILFYASLVQNLERSPSPAGGPLVEISSGNKDPRRLEVHAVRLSSELYRAVPEPTPPSSPAELDAPHDAVFLPIHRAVEPERIHEPQIRKRKSAADAFDEATERRRKARRKGGESVAAAAAVKTEDLSTTLKHRRSVSGSVGPLQTRPLSRSPSLASSRPPTARAPSEVAKRTSLLQVQSIGESEEATVEAKNKEVISRIVMAGMRLYGLSQSKTRKSRSNSAVQSMAIDDQREVEKQRDEEFKLVYHQVYKGTCFAFREHIASMTLAPHTESLRETVDKLLGIYCSDPLSAGLPGLADEMTPGGRKAFGSAGHASLGEQTAFSGIGNG